ncbi:MAG: hypothetical protein H7319_20615 [Spirosoma sp.]|nr:hypothetical protein [Spirosoma sp.]
MYINREQPFAARISGVSADQVLMCQLPDFRVSFPPDEDDEADRYRQSVRQQIARLYQSLMTPTRPLPALTVWFAGEPASRDQHNTSSTPINQHGHEDLSF